MPLTALTTLDAFECLLREPVAVVYKHSTRCAFSSWTHDEVLRFAGQRPDIPVRLVDVIADRVLSLDIAARLGVPHESPQALVLRDGALAWHGSHRAVRASALHQALRS